MTRKEQFAEALALAKDSGKNHVDRRAGLNDCIALKKAAKTSFEKLGSSAAEIDALDACINTAAQPPKPNAFKRKMKTEDAPKPAAKVARGAITAYVTELLLTTDASYATIVDDVKLSYPEAKTTTRSVASVAAALRRKGKKVSKRTTVGK